MKKPTNKPVKRIKGAIILSQETRLEQEIKRIKNLYDSFPSYVDRSTKDLLVKYNI